MKRIIKGLFVILVIFSCMTYAKTITENDAVTTFTLFIRYFNDNDETIYNYIDPNNEELISLLKNNLGKGNLTYDNINTSKVSETEYKVAAKVFGSGKMYGSTWSATNKFVLFDMKYDIEKDCFIVTNTDFFDAIGITSLRKAYSALFIKVLTIAFIIFIAIIVLTFIISRIAIKRETKKYINLEKVKQTIE